jgi:4-amino-4-deoxy-L-arabinose transferase-like glycosyltransferase
MITCVTVFAAIAAIYLCTAPGPGLIEPDEARYAEMARETLVTGDWLTPRVNFVEYFQKPPLVVWASAAAYATGGGASELGARLPSVLGALATVALTGAFAARIYGGAVVPLAMVIAGSAPLFAVMAVHAGLDMTFSSLIAAALFAAWFGIESGRPLWWRLAALAGALAVLAKGFAAVVIIGAVVGLHLSLHEGWRGLRRALDLPALGLFAAVSVPWFALMAWYHPGFLSYFVLEQHVGRYVGNVDHALPFWFLPAIMPLLLFPWGVLPLFDPTALRRLPPPRQWSAPTRFLALWALFVIGFFSLASSKLPNYVLPAVPPLAILLARFIDAAMADERTIALRRFAVVLIVAGLLTGLAAAIVPIASAHWRAQALAPFLYAGGLALAVTGAATKRLLAAQRPRPALAALAIGSVCAIAVVLAGRDVATSYRELGLAARAAMRPGDRLAVFRRNVHAVVFYSGQRALMIGGPGELRFGFDYGEHQAWFRPEHELWSLWADPQRMFLVLTRRELDAIDPPLDPPPILVASQHKKLLVVNRP